MKEQQSLQRSVKCVSCLMVLVKLSMLDLSNYAKRMVLSLCAHHSIKEVT